jgi:hypothetical protein
MTSEEALLNPRCCAACFAVLRPKIFEAEKTTLNECSRTRGMGDGEKAENLPDDLDVAGVVDIKPT